MAPQTTRACHSPDLRLLPPELLENKCFLMKTLVSNASKLTQLLNVKPDDGFLSFPSFPGGKAGNKSLALEIRHTCQVLQSRAAVAEGIHPGDLQ